VQPRAAAAAAAALARHQLWQPQPRQRVVRCQGSSSGQSGGGNQGDRMQNTELLVGDCLCLLAFALYKQVQCTARGTSLHGVHRVAFPPPTPSFNIVHPCRCSCHASQITALIFLPNFPGWLAPLAFNPVRFLELFSFAATLMGTWVASGYLTGGYRYTATSDMRAAVR
jgi:hypothetical protein